MHANIYVLLMQLVSIYSTPFDLHSVGRNANNDYFIFNVSSMVLEESEWKFMSFVSFDSNDIPQSPDFMMKFHNKVGPLVLSTLQTSSVFSRATFLLCGNIRNLLKSVEENPDLWSSATFYVILMRRIPQEPRGIFKVLWKKFYVIHVLMIEWENSNRIIWYNPFFDESIEHKVKMEDIARTMNHIREERRQKLWNLNGYPIRVTMFPTRLKAVPQPDGSFKGYDGIIMHTLAEHLNFTPIISSPKDGHKYGWKEENGTFTGQLGDIIYGRADIGFNGVFIKEYHSDKIQFTTPVQFDHICFIVPKARPKPKWKTVFLAFDSSTWAILLLTYWLTLLVWYLLKKVDRQCFDVTMLGLNLFRIILMTPINRSFVKCSERIMMATALLFGFVVASSFQGSMVKFLSYETYEPDIHTIREFAKSELPIMSASLNLRELFETDENPLISNLLSRFSWLENTDILGEIVRSKKAAAIGRKSDMEEKIAASYVKEDQVLLHIVEECPRSYHIAYIITKNSPYLSVFNDFINYIVEAGITQSWFIHSKPFRSLSDYHISFRQRQVVFTTENLIIAFIILFFGLSFSTLEFILEIVIHVYKKKKKR